MEENASKKVRAKFYCTGVARQRSDGGQNDSDTVSFSAVTATENPENKTWSKYTPSGSLTMTITNPACFDTFEVGKEYFIDLVPVSE